jgi:hypothetical protein
LLHQVVQGLAYILLNPAQGQTIGLQFGAVQLEKSPVKVGQFGQGDGGLELAPAQVHNEYHTQFLHEETK